MTEPAADTRLRDAIAAVIADGWNVRYPDSLADEIMPLVVAEVRSAAATAWDEGYCKAESDVDDGFTFSEAGDLVPAANPYRVEEAPPAEDEHTHEALVTAKGYRHCLCGEPMPAPRVDEPATPPAPRAGISGLLELDMFSPEVQEYIRRTRGGENIYACFSDFCPDHPRGLHTHIDGGTQYVAVSAGEGSSS